VRIDRAARGAGAAHPPGGWNHGLLLLLLLLGLVRVREQRRGMSTAQPPVAAARQEQADSPLAPAERIAERTTAVAGAGVVVGALRAVALNQPLKTPLALSTATNAGL
jgi:hypothetical protein